MNSEKNIPGAGYRTDAERKVLALRREFSKSLNYFTINIEEDDEDTDLLAAAERGLYHTLQKVYLRHKGPLPGDWQWLYLRALARTDADKRSMKALMPKRFKRVLIEGKAHWLNERWERELARIGRKMGAPDSHGAVDSGLHGGLHPQTISLNNQRNDLCSEEVKSEEVNKSLSLATAISSNDCSQTIVEEQLAAASIEAVPAPPTPTTQVGADSTATLFERSMLKHTSQLKGEPPPSVPAGPPPLEQSRCLGYSPLADTPWGDGKQWLNYEEWKADPTTGYAPTEEERERTQKAEFFRKLRNGDYFVH